jgi:hypothetical protein
MPGTNSRNLTLTPAGGGNFTVNVTYNAVFSAFERNLAGLGMTFVERISTLGVDPPGSTTGTVLAEFPAQVIPVPSGAGPVSVPRNRSIVLTRAQLDEDPSIIIGPDFDADEIRCRIRIQSTGLPPAVTPDAFTDQEVLGGLVIGNTAAAGASSD